MERQINKFTIHSFLIGLILACIHYNLISMDPILLKDDTMIIGAISNTSSFSQYWINFKDGVYWDLQPVRDLTLFVDIFLYKKFGWKTFHLTNVLIGFLILVSLRRNYKYLGFSDKMIFITISMLAVHPILNTTMAWITNRKHLLSILFLIFFFNDYLKTQSFGLKSLIFSVLSFLSQPITIFIPALYLIYERIFFKKKINVWGYSIFLVTLLLLVANHHFYHTNIRFLTRVAEDQSKSELGFQVLKLGRVAFQLIFPFRLSGEYDVGNILNFFGIIVWVLGFYFFWKKAFSLKRLFMAFILFSSLFPVLKWGPRDGYLLTSLGVLGLLLMMIVDKKNKEWTLLLGGYSLVLFYFSVYFTGWYKSDLILFKNSWENEGGVENYFRYAVVVASLNPQKGYDVLTEAINNYPQLANSSLRAMRSKYLYLTPHLSDEEKLKKYQLISRPDLFDVFFQLKILEKLKKEEEHKVLLHQFKKVLEEKKIREVFVRSVCVEFAEDCKKLNLLPSGH